MASWEDILNEIAATAAVSAHDNVRRRYLKALYEHTGRNVIAYYSAFQQKSQLAQQSPDAFTLNDQDINGFMAVIHKMDRTRGLDLILHTPGGGIAATEALVNYLRKMFDGNMRAIVPQIAMSAGTMLALACKSVVMGKHSSLGPIDPQIRGVPAHGVIDEFNQAKQEVAADPATIPIWQTLLGQYPPAFVYQCRQAIAWSNNNVEEWLKTGMFAGDTDAQAKATAVVSSLADPANQKVHDRHVPAEVAIGLGIKVECLEDNDDLQDAVLSVHHACQHTLTATQALKIIENHEGAALIHSAVMR
jgi:ATP-dependent protease ClpP protease subunit